MGGSETAAARVVGILLAAGASRRMTGTDKIFAPLAGHPLFYWGATLFEESEAVDATVIVATSGREKRIRDFAVQAGWVKVRAIVAGGARRQDSARAGLAAAAAFAAPAAAVLVHDAARPLADGKLLTRVLAALADADGAVPGVAVPDTIKRVDENGRVVATLARERLRAVQTPQAYELARLCTAYERAAREGYEVTDDAAALEQDGGRVVAVAGDIDNFKVTYAEDLARADALLRRR